MPPVSGYGYRQGPKPGVIPLQPLDVGNILGGAIATVRRYPGLMLGVTAIIATAVQLVTLLGTLSFGDASNEGDAAVAVVVLLAGLVLGVVSQAFLGGFVTVVVGSAVLGRPLSFGQAWAQVRPRLGPLIGLVLVYIAVLVPAIIVAVMLVIYVPPLGVLVIIGMMVVGVWLVTGFGLASPALVLEELGVGQAFRRSWALVKGAWWRIFGISLLAGVIGGFTSFLVTLPFELIGAEGSLLTVDPYDSKYLVWSSVGSVLASTFTQAFIVGCVVLLYLDQRIRREQLDVRLANLAAPQ
jgi:hypothetical protein